MSSSYRSDTTRWSADSLRTMTIVQHQPPQPNRSQQTAIMIVDMVITIAPIILLAGIWHKLHEVVAEMRKK